jgi:hypothetical protein
MGGEEEVERGRRSEYRTERACVEKSLKPKNYKKKLIFQFEHIFDGFNTLQFAFSLASRRFGRREAGEQENGKQIEVKLKTSNLERITSFDLK